MTFENLNELKNKIIQYIGEALYENGNNDKKILLNEFLFKKDSQEQFEIIVAHKNTDEHLFSVSFEKDKIHIRKIYGEITGLYEITFNDFSSINFKKAFSEFKK